METDTPNRRHCHKKGSDHSLVLIGTLVYGMLSRKDEYVFIIGNVFGFSFVKARSICIVTFEISNFKILQVWIRTKQKYETCASLNRFIFQQDELVVHGIPPSKSSKAFLEAIVHLSKLF
jgi:hypothetical protein